MSTLLLPDCDGKKSAAATTASSGMKYNWLHRRWEEGGRERGKEEIYTQSHAIKLCKYRRICPKYSNLIVSPPAKHGFIPPKQTMRQNEVRVTEYQ